MKTWQKLKKDPKLKKNLKIRSQVIEAIRLFFKWQEYLEVETPILVDAPCTESSIDFFQTRISFWTTKRDKPFSLPRRNLP